MALGPQALVEVHQQALVASLEQVVVFLSQAVESQGERHLQALHAFHQVLHRRFQREVIVVRHQAPRVDDSARLGAGFLQTLQEARSR